ncbi:hypothetical protein ERO13_A07G067900v2 [Gossypium hirsutum]|uniref:Transcription factor TCP5 n=1 Tax=Gossypium hirsutum TaxID=3635 RepID=A0ABM3C2C5_GOSHI|nr:transcription factor TCP5-like [Gossypium hirsutum]KAG4191064.1 hypothetical protein ERO13_A07G067900v2 [Gossypium hirsutum]
MISSSREKGCFEAKQEGDGGKVSSSRQWPGFRNPRIVRVSRSFGGKDRHSKVCTIRGLRDRRIRLSVPTAIQLYDLQDRLGLNQPSKVIDWLLEATKDDVDKLPPLEFHHSLMPNPCQSSPFTPLMDPNLMFMKDYEGETSMQVEREITDMKGKWIKEQEKLIFPVTNHGSSLPGGFMFNTGTNSMPLNIYNHHWNPSQFTNHGFHHHHQPENYFHGAIANTYPPLPSCPPPSTTPSHLPTFPWYGTNTNQDAAGDQDNSKLQFFT